MPADEQPSPSDGDMADPLMRLVAEGKAGRVAATGEGPLPTLKLLKPVPDLQQIIRDAKSLGRRWDRDRRRLPPSSSPLAGEGSNRSPTPPDAESP